jgi:hypothetical protein
MESLSCGMPREFRRYDPDQSLLLPPSLRDWLPEDHLAFFISDAIDAMDLSAFEGRYGDEGPGKQAFDPRMMLKVLVYAYATGTFSSRKIAAKLHEDVAYRVHSSVKRAPGRAERSWLTAAYTLGCLPLFDFGWIRRRSHMPIGRRGVCRWRPGTRGRAPCIPLPLCAALCKPEIVTTRPSYPSDRGA